MIRVLNSPKALFPKGGKLLLVLLLLTQLANGQEAELVAGQAKLVVFREGAGYALRFHYKGAVYATINAASPISLEVDSVTLTGTYQQVKKAELLLICQGRVTTKNGTEFWVTDTLTGSATGEGFGIRRQVRVRQAHAVDQWFNSRFGIQNSHANTLTDLAFFAPGIWYVDNKNLRSNSLASDYADTDFMFREDRLPLPVAMWRDKATGQTVSLMHTNAVPATYFAEQGRRRVVDARLQFAALGFAQHERTSLLLLYPGSEGAKTYVGGGKEPSWAFRSHPVRPGVLHRYQVEVHFSQTPDYAAAVATTWRLAYQHYAPALHPVNMRQVFTEQIALLDYYWANMNGAPGWPFSVYLPSGTARTYNYQMGFIGFQPSNAYYLLRQGLAKQDPELVRKGTAVIDFWVKNAPTASGLPKSWVDAPADRPFEWRRYESFLRIMGDGSEGILQAWSILKKHGTDKKDWLTFCKNVGNWLVRNQNQDGSYYLSYDWWADGRASHQSKSTSTNAIRFLVELYYVTDNDAYLQAALKAGEFSYATVHRNYQYVGSVIDNPNVQDRESGQQALYAFLALYDITANPKWLVAAVQAAHYTATFVYTYPIPMAQGDTLTDFPAHKQTTGQALIATGHSAVDNGFSYSSFQYYRLYLYTGDQHFLDLAHFGMYNTLQTADFDGKMRYRFKALQTEAFGLAGNARGHSIRQWLPWTSSAVMDPLLRFQDAFGELDLRVLSRRSLSEQQRLNNAYKQNFGLAKATEHD